MLGRAVLGEIGDRELEHHRVPGKSLLERGYEGAVCPPQRGDGVRRSMKPKSHSGGTSNGSSPDTYAALSRVGDWASRGRAASMTDPVR